MVQKLDDENESRGYIPYGRQWIDDDDIKAVVDVLRSDWMTQGPRVKEFEDRFAEYCGVKYAVAVTSGTAALHVACLAAGIGKGDELITTPITFAASSNCALYVGATPVFVDIDPETICLDNNKLKQYLSDRSKADKAKVVVPVHFAGLPCDMEAIHNTAVDNGLIVIEDACHALGAQYPSGERTGSCKYSDMTVFSFHPVKHIATGEGGMITTNSPELYEKLMMLRTHGITRNVLDTEMAGNDYYYEMQMLGFNYRMTDIQAALGISQLKKLDFFLERRRDIASCYNEAFNDLDDYINLPPDNNGKHAWHIYVIRLKTGSRDRVFRKLREDGIGVQVHYIPVHFHPYYRNRFAFKEGDYPVAERYYAECLTLPVYPAMTDNDIKRVVAAVRECQHVK